MDAHERLSTLGARGVFGHELDAWQRYADESIAPMASVESGERTWEIQESPGNRVRYRRTIDFARPGDRVFDVGFGRGYLAAVLLRDRGVASYRGIEILDDKVDGTRDLFRANDLDDSSVFLEQGDLYDLTLASVGDVDFMICCEVLEHVPDPEQALRVLADALPEGADLLFTLPMAGRLEQVWGHASVFDVARVKQMLDGAGLVAQHVEPMANTWTLVVASRDPGSSDRVQAALSRPPERVSQPLVSHRGFVDVPAEGIGPVGPGSAVTPAAKALEAAPTLPAPHSVGQTVLLEATGPGGLTMVVTGLEAARLKIGFFDAAHVQRVVTIGRVGEQEVCRWTWTPSQPELARQQSRRWLRPGESGPGILAGRHERLEEVDRLDVLLEQPDGAVARMWVAVAYLP